MNKDIGIAVSFVIQAITMVVIASILLLQIDEQNNEIKNMKMQIALIDNEQIETNTEEITLTQNAVLEMNDNLNKFVEVHDENVEVLNDAVAEINNIIDYLND